MAILPSRLSSLSWRLSVCRGTHSTANHPLCSLTTFGSVPRLALCRSTPSITTPSCTQSLQADITKRMSNGLAVQAAYTWAHTIDNSSDPLVPAAGNQEFPRDSFNLAAERGNS